MIGVVRHVHPRLERDQFIETTRQGDWRRQAQTVFD
jgi:hypothetical protein